MGDRQSNKPSSLAIKGEIGLNINGNIKIKKQFNYGRLIIFFASIQQF